MVSCSASSGVSQVTSNSPVLGSSGVMRAPSPALSNRCSNASRVMA
jgi:hypothetical protein